MTFGGTSLQPKSPPEQFCLPKATTDGTNLTFQGRLFLKTVTINMKHYFLALVRFILKNKLLQKNSLGISISDN